MRGSKTKIGEIARGKRMGGEEHGYKGKERTDKRGRAKERHLVINK